MGVFLAEHTHGRRFLKDAKIIAAQLTEDSTQATQYLCAALKLPLETTWGEIAAIVLAKE